MFKISAYYLGLLEYSGFRSLIKYGRQKGVYLKITTIAVTLCVLHKVQNLLRVVCPIFCLNNNKYNPWDWKLCQTVCNLDDKLLCSWLLFPEILSVTQETFLFVSRRHIFMSQVFKQNNSMFQLSYELDPEIGFVTRL